MSLESIVWCHSFPQYFFWPGASVCLPHFLLLATLHATAPPPLPHFLSWQVTWSLECLFLLGRAQACGESSPSLECLYCSALNQPGELLRIGFARQEMNSKWLEGIQWTFCQPQPLSLCCKRRAAFRNSPVLAFCLVSELVFHLGFLCVLENPRPFFDMFVYPCTSLISLAFLFVRLLKVRSCVYGHAHPCIDVLSYTCVLFWLCLVLVDITCTGALDYCRSFDSQQLFSFCQYPGFLAQ